MKTKRILGAILSLAMAISVIPSALADTDVAAMEKALTTVKSRIEIPAELTEFRSNSYEYDGAARYSFTWSEKDGDDSINVSCNGSGQLLSYSYNVGGNYRGEQKLPSVSKDAASAAAETFLAKAAPETVSDENDRLKFVSAHGGYNDSYSVEFEREKNGVTVADNTATIHTELDEDGKIYVSYAYINYSYGAKFEDEAEKIESPEEKYEETYPAELIYRSKYDYELYRSSGKYEPQLVYRVKDGAAGYISAYTGEVVEREYEKYGDRNAAMESMAVAEDEGAYSGGGLTKREIAELETVAGLYTASEAEKFLKSVPQLKIDKDYKVTNSSVRTTGEGEDKSYTLSLDMGEKDEDYGNVYAIFDAQKDRLTYYSNYTYRAYDKNAQKLTDAEKSKASSEIDAFLKAVLPDKIAEFDDVTKEDSEPVDSVYKNYYRIVNGIPYIGNTINVTYDAVDEKITRYNLTYDDDAKFTDPEGALSAEDAYNHMKDLAPINEYYIYSGGMYRLVYGMDGSPMIDAYTGEDIYKDENIDYTEIEYDDISGHWCEEAVNALRDYGIAFPGESFNPNAEMNQQDLLRLFLAGIEGRYYMGYDADSIYDECFRERVLTKDERKDEAAVAREQAFVYMIRLAGYDKVASLSDIYKVSYADGDQLSDGLIGYAAILSGMGIIEGDGGNIRPSDSITRAEAAVMLYRYMK